MSWSLDGPLSLKPSGQAVDLAVDDADALRRENARRARQGADVAHQNDDEARAGA